MRFSDAVDDFVQTCRSAQTRAAYRSDLRQFLKWLSGRSGAGADSITKFTKDNVVAYLDELRGRSRADSTRHRKLACFRQFGKWAVDERLLTSDPVASVKGIARRRRLPRPFSLDEANRIMALPLNSTENALRSVLFFAGLRATPAGSLKVKQIHPDRLTYIAKGGHERSVPLFPGLKDILWDYLASHTDMKGETFIFRNSYGRPFSRRKVEQLTKAWGQAAGVPHCIPHRFRHSFGTELLKAEGSNLRQVQEAMGHADISSTAIYTQVVQTDLAKTIAKLPFGQGHNNPPRGSQ